MYVISFTTSRLTVRDHFHRVSAKRVLQLLHLCMVCAQAFLSLATGAAWTWTSWISKKQPNGEWDETLCSRIGASVSHPLSRRMGLNWLRKAKSMTSGSHPPNGWIKPLAHPKVVLKMKCNFDRCAWATATATGQFWWQIWSTFNHHWPIQLEKLTALAHFHLVQQLLQNMDLSSMHLAKASCSAQSCVNLLVPLRQKTPSPFQLFASFSYFPYPRISVIYHFVWFQHHVRRAKKTGWSDPKHVAKFLQTAPLRFWGHRFGKAHLWHCGSEIPLVAWTGGKWTHSARNVTCFAKGALVHGTLRMTRNKAASLLCINISRK